VKVDPTTMTVVKEEEYEVTMPNKYLLSIPNVE